MPPVRRLSLAIVMLACLWPAAAAQGRPAGASGVRPFVEGEEPAVIETEPADQTTPLGVAVSLVVKGKELVKFEAKGLPAGLTAEQVSTSEWKLAGKPTAIAAAATVTLLAENPGHGAPVERTFKWTIAGITPVPSHRAIVGEAIEIPLTGQGLAGLKTAKALPEGLKLEDITGETEWKITGTPAKPGTVEVEVQGEEAAKEPLPAVVFNLTVAGINELGPRAGTVGVPLRVPINGVELKTLTAEPLPPGLELKEVSESEWEIAGTPTVAGPAKIEVKGTNGEKPLPGVTFELTIAPAEAPPPPTSSGRLTIAPAAAFAAAKSTCGGVAWSPAAVATQWLLDGAPIAGATSTSFTAPRVDDGHVLSCRQTATGANGAVAQQTSPGATVHEQPPQPAWPIGPAAQHCATPVCMEDGPSAQTPPTITYQQGGSWLAASQVRCVSAPWTSVAGTSALPAVESLAEAHAITVTLQRITPSGPVTVAGEELASLAAPADALEGTLAGSPFAGNVAAGYGSQAFTAGELWPRMFKSSLGLPDRFVAGQGYIAYQLAATGAVRRSFQLLYNLTAADLGSRMRCVVEARDGPVQAPTAASLASPEYAVAAGRACGPRNIAHIGGPQPAVVLAGSRRCLAAPAGLAEIGGAVTGVSVVAGRSSVLLECALAAGCRGKLTLAGGGGTLASVKVSLARGGRRLVSLKLSPQGRSLVRRAGSGGLAANLGLAAGGATRQLASLRLLQVA